MIYANRRLKCNIRLCDGSVSRLAIAPRTVGEVAQIHGPELSQSPFTTGFALLPIGSVNGIACEHAHLAAVVAFVAADRGIINLGLALFAAAYWQRVIYLLFHVDLQKPVLNLFLLGLCD